MFLRLAVVLTVLAAAVPVGPSASAAPPVAADDFSLTVAPVAVTAVAGHPARATVDTATTSGAPQPVALRVTNLPAGVFAAVTPATVTSGASATVSVQTSVSARAGTFTLVVEGVGATLRRQAALRLVVRTPTAVRAAFYYPWFPEAWRQGGLDPYTNYRPSRGSYTVDATVVREQVADMRYGGITVGLASWFGQGTTTDRHWPALFQGARDTGFAWAPYYEPEGRGRPTPDQIAADLHYLRSTYGGDRSALAVLPGRGMVVFVYNALDLTMAEGCGTVDRWVRARSLLQRLWGESIYLNLKVFSGYRHCANSVTVDGWHQYAPAHAESDFSGVPGGAYSVSPGFWKAGLPYGRSPFLARSLDRWRAGVARMTASGAFWQLVTTYNEWGEGTAIESSVGCRGVAPAGALCDWSGGGRSEFVTVLHDHPPVVTSG
ncbi:glycoside hydrolase family 71/99 protein [Micromonospora sp. AKA38]|uniref:hypothetical protein n=1 Tax=Micromonospora sp. AKA38 TaxID=2733861 RepID=UPI0022C1FE95|nr:hypothetical protein [Micromonospora sp. AKA38]GHJ18225.1 hypothetical protein TPA0908_62200 [Micromonospora sp. AKA38]